MVIWRNFDARAVALGLCLITSGAGAVGICEVPPNEVPPTCEPKNAFALFEGTINGAPPAGNCPEGSRPDFSCSEPLPPAGIRCRTEDSVLLCFAAPKGVLEPLSYAWSSSNTQVYFSGNDADVSLSCAVDVNALISVVISDNYGRSATAQKLVYCRKPRTGNVLR